METQKRVEAIYDYDAKPKFSEILSLALQHVIASVVGIITPGLIIAQACKLSEADTTLIIQTSLVFAAISTLAQVFPLFGKFGARLPLMMGASFAYVPILLSIGVEFGISAIFGAQLIGGIVVTIVGLFIDKIRFIFPPIVTGTVVLSIGFSLFPVAIKYMAGGAGKPGYGSWQSWLVAIVTFVVVFYLNNFGKGFLKLSAILVGMIVGYVLALFLGMVDFAPIGHAAILQPIPPLHFGMEFKAVPIATLIVMYLVNAVQIMGESGGLTYGVFDREPSNQEISGTIVGNGLANILGSFFGSVPCGTFGQNVGLVISTKAINKYIFTLASGILFVAGILPKFASVLTTVPQSVIGGATVSVFATIAMIGMRTIADAGLTPKNTSIVGISLAFGVGVALSEGSLAGFPGWVTTIFGSSEIVLTTIIAIVLNLILNGPAVSSKK